AAAMIAAEADGGEGRARRHEGRSREDAGPVARPAVARAPAPHSPVHRYAAGLAVARRARGERGESHARDLDAHSTACGSAAAGPPAEPRAGAEEERRDGDGTAARGANGALEPMRAGKETQSSGCRSHWRPQCHRSAAD